MILIYGSGNGGPGRLDGIITSERAWYESNPQLLWQEVNSEWLCG